MGLPFLDRKRMTSSIMEKRASSGERSDSFEYEPSVGGSDEEKKLEDHMGALLAGIERKSPSDMAAAFKAAFECCESYPHEEYDDDGSDSGEQE